MLKKIQAIIKDEREAVKIEEGISQVSSNLLLNGQRREGFEHFVKFKSAQAPLMNAFLMEFDLLAALEASKKLTNVRAWRCPF